MVRKSIKTIQNQKNIKKITCLTAYTTSIAKIIDRHVDIILVGDSLGTAIYGMKNTQSVTLNMMMSHGKAVCDSSKKAFTIIDMPYQTYDTKKDSLANAKKLINYTKCQSIKLEIDEKNINIVKHLTEKNITVVAHIGVTPQKYKNFNKIKSVGNNDKEKNRIIDLAINLEKAGASIIVLECVKESLASIISNVVNIPTIGIGASPNCDGQVLVTNDILEMEKFTTRPRFIKSYVNLNFLIEKAVKKYCIDVIKKKFPRKINTY